MKIRPTTPYSSQVKPKCKYYTRTLLNKLGIQPPNTSLLPDSYIQAHNLSQFQRQNAESLLSIRSAAEAPNFHDIHQNKLEDAIRHSQPKSNLNR